MAHQELMAQLAATVPCPSRLGKGDEYASLVEQIINNGYLNGEVRHPTLKLYHTVLGCCVAPVHGRA